MPQGFKWIRNGSFAVPSRLTHIPGTVGETFTRGEAVSIVSGSFTKAANGAAIAGFAAQTKTCTASDAALEVTEARADDVFEAPYTGTADATFKAGANTVDVAADGLSVLASDVTGGALVVMSTNTTKATCRVRVKNRQLS